MSREPIRVRSSFNRGSCGPLCYGVLVGVSTGYPPDTGKLLTRYAPLRRSPAEYCYSPLPLDLHVLSLPLAFILSQDQTLHCIISIILSLILLTVQSLSFKKLTLLEFLICYRFLFRYLLVLVLTSLVNDLFSFSAMPVFERRGLQRYELFRIPQIFFKFFKNFFLPRRSSKQPFSEAGCKGTLFSFTSKSFSRFF